MREILFRGKRIDNGEFVYGWLSCIWGRYYIHVEADRLLQETYPVTKEAAEKALEEQKC